MMIHRRVSVFFRERNSRSRKLLVAVGILAALDLAMAGPRIAVAGDPCLDPPYHGDAVFDDTPAWAMEYVARATDMGIVYGCTDTHFCSTESVSRAEMAVFLELAAHGATYSPPPAEGIFEDVTGDYEEFACWAEALFNDQVTTGCPVPPAFCPDGVLNRAEMSTFLIRLIEGPGYDPPPCTGVFDDVDCGHFWAAGYIEDIYARGITTGCSGSPEKRPFLYCPLKDVNRAQAATFLDRSVRYGECVSSLAPPTNITGN